jgi:hypothetical protein
MTDAATLSGGRADQSLTSAERAARLMGWASFGLAAAMLAMPKRITEIFGLEGKENLIRAFGGQEVLAGIGALSVDPTPHMWGRAGGDLVHMGTLATGLSSQNPDQRRNIAIGLGALAGFLIVDSLIAGKLKSERSEAKGERRDYSGRSGFPKGVEQSRGAARDFQTPPDFKAAPQGAGASPELQSA